MSALSSSQTVIQISTRKAKLNIRHKRPQFTVRHKRPQMEIRKRAPQFKINRSSSHTKIRRENPVQISSRFLRSSANSSSNYTERLVNSERISGYDSSKISSVQSSAGSALEMIAAENERMTDMTQAQSIEWDKGYLEINWTKNMMEIDWDIAYSPEIYVEPHDIQIYVQSNIRRADLVNVKKLLPKAKIDRKI